MHAPPATEELRPPTPQWGNLGEADKNATKAIGTARDAKERANAHFRRGVVLMAFSADNGKRLPAAESEFRQALIDVPFDAYARLQLGIALLKQNKDPEGIKELAIVAAGPDGHQRRREGGKLEKLRCGEKNGLASSA